MLTSANIQQYRLETPGTAHNIHFNNAGASLMSNGVVLAVKNHLDAETRHGGYEASAMYQQNITDFYPAVARIFGCKPHQIAYTTNATDAYSRALSSIPFESGDSILTTYDDYVSNQLAFLQLRNRCGISIDFADLLPTGGVDPQSIREKIKQKRPKLIAVTHMPTNSGLIQDVQSIGQICRQEDILYLVDGCQTAGQLPIDLQEMGCDFFSATFRKFLRGPRGTGFLYVSDRVLDKNYHPLFIDLHSANWRSYNDYQLAPGARRYELWERPYAMMIGAKVAAEQAGTVGLNHIARRTKKLADALRVGLSRIEKIQVLDRGENLGAIVTLHATGWNGNDFKTELNRRNVNSSIVLTESARFDFAQKNIDWAVRLSPHYYNLEEEVDTVTDIIESFV